MIIILFMVIIFNFNLLSQTTDPPDLFTQYKFSILGGINFTTIPTIGSSIYFEAITPLTSNLNIKASAGFLTVYDDTYYEVKGNQFFVIDGEGGYSTYLYEVDKIEYTMIPLNIGLEYFILDPAFSPYVTADAGYNFSTSEEQIVAYYDGIGGVYESIFDVPEEYQGTPSAIEDGSSFTAGIGLGLRYSLSTSIKLDLRYVYKYNGPVVNSNQFLFGVIL